MRLKGQPHVECGRTRVTQVDLDGVHALRYVIAEPLLQIERGEMAAHAKIAIGRELKIMIARAARAACVYIHEITGSAVCPVHSRAVFKGIDLTKHNRARRLRENEKRTCESNSAESSHAAQMLISSAQQKQD